MFSLSSEKAGGCPNNKETFLNNPQYAFTTTEDDENGEVVLIALQQKDRRAERAEGKKNYTIGFHVMKVENNRRTIVHEKGKTVVSSTYINSRRYAFICVLDGHVLKRLKLKSRVK